MHRGGLHQAGDPGHLHAAGPGIHGFRVGPLDLEPGRHPALGLREEDQLVEPVHQLLGAVADGHVKPATRRGGTRLPAAKLQLRKRAPGFGQQPAE